MKRRLVVITELIAPYRIPVFNALARREDIALTVIFLSRTDTTIRDWKVYESEIRFDYEVLPSWRKRIGGFHLLLNRNMGAALSRLVPDVIVCGGYNYLASWQALNWAKRRGVPFLLWSESTARDMRRGRAIPELLKKKFLRECSGFIVPGMSARDYLRNLGVLERNIFVARNAVDTALFASQAALALKKSTEVRRRLALPERYFLFVGRLVANKGVGDLLQAYARLGPEIRSQVALVYAGDGPMRAELESRSRAIAPGHVHFAGFVHREELGNYYALAECFVFPTRSDPWGLVVNEAMSCGLPIICAEVAGCAADLVRDNGRLVSAGDVQGLSTVMHEVACNPSLRYGMSSASSELIREYSPETCAAGFVQASAALEAHAG